MQILFFGLVAAAFSEMLDVVPASKLVASLEREGKNLLGTFPFNTKTHHGDHGSAAHRFSHPERAERQRSGDEVALDIGSIAAAGERCIDKVVMIEETVYDDVITCKHSYR